MTKHDGNEKYKTVVIGNYVFTPIKNQFNDKTARNSFLLHRISNDKDQELVSKLIPDNLRGLLRELPSLPARYAILLGWVSELPVVVKMNELKEMERPRSDDPHFWDVWTKDYRIANWDEVVSSWQDERSN